MAQENHKKRALCSQLTLTGTAPFLILMLRNYGAGIVKRLWISSSEFSTS